MTKNAKYNDTLTRRMIIDKRRQIALKDENLFNYFWEIDCGYTPLYESGRVFAPLVVAALWLRHLTAWQLT